MDKYEYCGHLHIHSKISDGAASIREISRIGREAGLDFLLITDHNSLEGREAGLEGWHDGILVAIGTEINWEKNHYIACGIHELVPQDNEDPQKVIDAVNAQGGFGYLAHPGEKGNPLFMQGAAFPWDRWDIQGFAGLEIWNFSSLWREAYRSRAAVLYWYFVDRYRAVRFPRKEIIQKWDQLLAHGPVWAFGGGDAHAYPVNIGPLKLSLFAYEYLFRTINTHLLLEERLSLNSFEAVEQVLEALRRGSFFVGSDYLLPTRGFRFSAINGSAEGVSMGGTICHSPETVLRIIAPTSRGLVRIIHDGEVVYQSRRQVLVFKVLKPGTFRVEVYLYPRARLRKPVPWIYSNPIFVKAG